MVATVFFQFLILLLIVSALVFILRYIIVNDFSYIIVDDSNYVISFLCQQKIKRTNVMRLVI